MKNAQDAQKKVSSEKSNEDTEMNNPLATTSCEQETCNKGIIVTLDYYIVQLCMIMYSCCRCMVL